MHRSHIHAAVGVDEITAIRRILDGVVSVTVGKGDQAGAVEVNPIEVHEVRVLVRILATGAEPDLSLFSSTLSMPRTTY